jgi:hypothetical protein
MLKLHKEMDVKQRNIAIIAKRVAIQDKELRTLKTTGE